MIVFPALPVRNDFASIAFHKVIFARDECQAVLASLDEGAWQEGLVGQAGAAGGGFRQAPETRSCRQQRLPVDSAGYPLNRIVAEACQANSDLWKFELSGIVGDDLPWVMRYDDGGRGHYDWHVDLGQAANAGRKLAISVQLSDAADYQGGDLEFHKIEMDREAARQIGTMIVFPAYWPHRISPLTRGRRQALVGWLHGPSFR